MTAFDTALPRLAAAPPEAAGIGLALGWAIGGALVDWLQR